MLQTPVRDATQVLDWIMSRHVHEYLDVAGRPVGEGRAAAFRRTPTEMQTCPYAGTRHHHPKPMNVSALRQIAPVWEDVRTLLSWLSRRYRAAWRRDITTYGDLSLVTSSGAFLADYLALRRHRPLRSGEVPVVISSLYKVCLGFQLATFFGSMEERFSQQTAPPPLPDPAGFFDNLEAHELLIGEAEVCAGSAVMIMQAYEAMAGRGAVAPGELPAACRSLDIAWERVDLFARHVAGLWDALVGYVMWSERLGVELSDPRLPPDVQARLNACLKRREAQLRAGQKGLVVEIARGAARYAGDGRGAAAPAEAGADVVPPGPDADRGPDPPGLAATVFAWLNKVAAADTRAHAPVVAGALRARLAPYDAYEASVLARINEDFARLMEALGLDRPAAPLAAASLSRVCGTTLRDWGAETRET